ncbi:MAG TPA: ATP-binding protein [Thermoleophilia bacterium]|nr:ATP-binding protein [Thermoleophilia bacterium]
MQAISNGELQITVPMDAGNLADLRWRAWSYLTAATIAPGMVEDILIALHEAVANALAHSASATPIRVRLRATRTRVTVEVADEGVGIDAAVHLPPRPPSLLAEGGRGLFMIWTLMNSVRLVDSPGTHLVMVKDLFPNDLAGRAAAD